MQPIKAVPYHYASTSRAQSFASTSSAFEPSSRRLPMFGEPSGASSSNDLRHKASYYADSLDTGIAVTNDETATTDGSRLAMLGNDSSTAWTGSRTSLRKRAHGKHRADDDSNDTLPVVPTYDRSILGIKIRSITDHTRQRWTRSKMILLAAVTVELAVGIAALVLVLLVWLGPIQYGRTLRIINMLELDLATTAACLAVLTGLLGLHGVLLNNRAMLAWFNLLLWVVLAFSASVGYTSYKMRTYNLRGKLSEAWSRDYTVMDKVALQNGFACCGFLDPFNESIISQRCFSRSLLPGCLGPLLRHERHLLKALYIAAFSVVGWQLVCIAVALTCSLHVSERFGQGKRPVKVRLREAQAVREK